MSHHDPRPLTYSTCQSCGARMLWCLTVNGRRMPLDEHTVDDGTGNVLIEQLHGGIIRGRVLSGGEMPHDGPAYVPHHRTCPAAAEYRRRTDVSTPRCARLDCRAPLDEWLVDRGYTKHIGCITPAPDAVRTAATVPTQPPAPVGEQGDLLDLLGGE